MIGRVAQGQTTFADAQKIAPVLRAAWRLAEAPFDDGSAWQVLAELRQAVRGLDAPV